jgi:hypothetical protein
MVSDAAAIVAGLLLLAFARPFSDTYQSFFARPSGGARRFDVLFARVFGAGAAIWGAVDLLR